MSGATNGHRKFWVKKEIAISLALDENFSRAMRHLSPPPDENLSSSVPPSVLLQPHPLHPDLAISDDQHRQKISDARLFSLLSIREAPLFSQKVRRRLPDFSPNRVLDFVGPSLALWAMRDVWPQSIQTVNLVEPSKEMQRASQSLFQNLKGLPLIHSYDSIHQELNCKLDKKNRHHDLVVSSYALDEIPSLTDRITIVRQLWDLTSDVWVLLEPGTPHGSKIISQMRSYILWMEKRRSRKLEKLEKNQSSDVTSIVVSKPTLKDGSFVVAPCPHDGKCPLENTSTVILYSDWRGLHYSSTRDREAILYMVLRMRSFVMLH